MGGCERGADLLRRTTSRRRFGCTKRVVWLALCSFPPLCGEADVLYQT
jgi:hypothetical protein